MSDALHALADAAGLERRWRDVAGEDRIVSDETLRAALGALGWPAEDDRAAEESRRRLAEETRRPRPLYTADPGGAVDAPLPPGARRARVRLEGGGTLDLELGEAGDGPRLRAPDEAGLHEVEIGSDGFALAVAPPRAPSFADLTGRERGWGTAVQTYALRERTASDMGDFGDLAVFAAACGARGCDALLISPAHALYLARPDVYSPYAPSSRLHLNPLFAEADAAGASEPTEDADPLVDWPAASRRRVAALRAAFERSRRDPEALGRLRRFQEAGGESLRRHALFEAIDARQRALGAMSRDAWPAEFAAPDAPGARAFAEREAEEVDFHAFAQMRAAEGLERAQAEAKRSGMGVGLIADLAVGVDPGGSEAWSRPGSLLEGLTVGAPPDLFQAAGQNWGVTALSPFFLRRDGYAAFLETLRAALGRAGGLRIDHAMGLRRLWVVPSGFSAADGVYLDMGEPDLLRLLRLEAARSRSLLVGEDLGTVPEGFADALGSAGVLGMSVLAFEQDAGRFRPPAEWRRDAVAMTGTHDLPTVAGWWRGRDLELRRELLGEDVTAAEAERRRAREALWAMAAADGEAEGDAPDPETVGPACDAAVGVVAAAPAPLAAPPVEDLIAQVEQINLPGDVGAHPNWRRRLPADARTLFSEPGASRRISRLNARIRP